MPKPQHTARGWRALNANPGGLVCVLLWLTLPGAMRMIGMYAAWPMLYQFNGLAMAVCVAAFPFLCYMLVQKALTPRLSWKKRLLNRGQWLILWTLLVSVTGVGVLTGLAVVLFPPTMVGMVDAPIYLFGVSFALALALLLLPAFGGAVCGETSLRGAWRRTMKGRYGWLWLGGGAVLSLALAFVGLVGIPFAYCLCTGNTFSDSAGTWADVAGLPVAGMGLYFAFFLTAHRGMEQ